jgi:hypothetical protein
LRRGATASRLALLLCVLLAVAASGEEDAAAAAPLGVSETALRAQFGEALREVEVARPASVYEQIAGKRPGDDDEAQAEPPRDLYAGQKRLTRKGEGDVQRIELELHEGRTYRVRWQLAPRFERPLMTELVARLGQRLGPPDYDQTLRAELGAPRSELRRTGWNRGDRVFELRQLHPFTGGPVFLSVAERPALQAIVDAGGTPLPQPEHSGEWWRRAQRDPQLPSERERAALVAAIAQLVDSLLAEPEGRS